MQLLMNVVIADAVIRRRHKDISYLAEVHGVAR